MAELAVLDDPAAAAAALHPVRARLLSELARAPASAAGAAARVGLSRQSAGYHLTALQERGLVVEVAQRRHGGLVERVLAASAGGYLVSPAALGPAAPSLGRIRDRLSAAYAVALAARVVRELGALVHGAERAGKRLPSLAIDVDLRLSSAAERAAFAADLAGTVRSLAARYHDETTTGGRWYRVVVLSHPRPIEEQT